MLSNMCIGVNSVKSTPLDPSAGETSESNQQPLALCTMGAGYSRPIPPSNWQSKVCFSGCGLLHQMGRGGSVS